MVLIFFNQVAQNSLVMEAQNIQMGSYLSISEPFPHYLQLNTNEKSSEKLECIHHS